MRVTLLTVVVALIALSIHSSAAADPECIYRQIRNLPMHWVNPTDCGRFYRCTNKNVKKEIICSGDKEYNPNTGICANAGQGYCKLSLAAPLAEEVNVCANEVTGAFLPEKGRCRDFYICNDNLAYPQSCDPGSTFNTTSASCVPDTNSNCWENFCLKKSDGTYLPDPTSCLSFYVCDSTNTIAQNCGSGSYFNTTENNCQPDINNNICWENFCLKVTDGEMVKNPVNCHGYYLCDNKIATPQECRKGEYFDLKTNNCQPGECPNDETTTTSTTTSTTTTTTSTTISTTTPTTTTPTTTTTHDCSETTTPVPCEGCTCPGGYKEGELLPYPGNCQYFYICTGGALVQESCQEGNYFDEKLQVCSPDVNGVCPQCSRNYRRARRSLAEKPFELEKHFKTHIDAESEPQPSCLGRYFENQLVAHYECNKYQICVDGEMHTRICGFGSYFNEEFSACIRDEHNICKAEETVRKLAIEDNTQEIIQDPVLESVEEIAQHIIKENAQESVLETEEITQENVQEPVLQTVEENVPASMVDNTTSSCCEQDASGCTCPGGYQPGEIKAHPTDCDKYYVCENGQLILHDCGQGNMFNSCYDVCVPDTEHICWPKKPDNTPSSNICVGQPNGQMLANQNQCNAFYQCVNGVPQPGTCNTGEWFNPVKGNCEIDVNGDCINPCANTTGIAFLPHPDCTQFYFCNNGQSHVENCTEGGFNVNYGVCTLNTTCEANMCRNKPDGTTFPVSDDKSKFYLCLSGVATIHNCLPNTEYNENLDVCLKIPSANCNQTICSASDVLGAFPTLNGSENSFCYCRDGVAHETDCPLDYVFNTELGICYSNAPCDPEICQEKPEYTVSVNRNDTHSFCLCVMKIPVIVDCPTNATFYPKILRCRGNVKQNPNCNANFCLDQPNFTTTPAPNTTTGFCVCEDGSSTYHSCPSGTIFNSERGICLPPTFYCDVKKCASGANTIFPAIHDQYAFCYCRSTTDVELRNCPKGSTFSKTQLVCIPELCDSKQCLNSANQDVPFPAIDNPYGYCLCDGNGNAVLHECLADQIFDTTHQVCVDEKNVECDISLCQQKGKPYPYDIPAINDPYSFCYCINNSTVEIFHCPLNKIYNADFGACLDENLQPQPDCDTCTCPGGYPAGSILPHPQYCSQYYICSQGVLQLQNCGTGNFFNANLGVCQPDVNGTCKDNRSACTCVGAYREGEMIAIPSNRNLYYRCLNSQLHQETCTSGYYFSAEHAACVPATPNAYWFNNARSAIEPQDKSTDIEDFSCRNNTKRSVPSNCSEYEICQDAKWHRYTCTNHRYYNPEEQKCLEPRDDTVCNYAKVSGLPECNNQTDQQTLPHKYISNCSQYYRCTQSKWRLKSCDKNEYYSRHVRTCMPTILKNVCEARNISEAKAYAATLGQISTIRCRHTDVRPYMGNCEKYLMCLEGEWWYQYCPLGMYFNQTLNYCVPNDNGQCVLLSSKNQEQLVEGFEFVDQNCTQDGELRPSALDCDSYYICRAGKWKRQTCGKIGLYYNATSKACAPDIDGMCDKLKMTCRKDKRREFPLNCTAYEVCENGAWKRRSCELNSAYDFMLQQCVPNVDGQCSINGLRKVCHSGEIRSWPVAGNCTQFQCCEADTWLPVACLNGHTFSAYLRACVPHVPTDHCRPMWNSTANLTTLPTDGISEIVDNVGMTLPGDIDSICLNQDDGTFVAHPTDCTRFYLCLHEMPGNEQECDIGSFFDTSIGYCRPNDGSCIVQLTGPCKNASDGDLLPNLEDCLTYYHCSILNGTTLFYCPEGNYYHRQSQKCRVDNGDCRNQSIMKNCEHGTRLPHERYCNIYYACVRGLAIPIECSIGYQFNPVLGHCLIDEQHKCLRGEVVMHSNETSYNCSKLTDSTYLPDRADCTRYYICSNGQAQAKRCEIGAYFDSQQMLCVSDDGSCPFVAEESNNKLPNPPDPIVCEGKHGDMLPDPINCNEFYVCINGKLRHERCYTNYFFNTTISQCQAYDSGDHGNITTIEAIIETNITTNSKTTEINTNGESLQLKCTDKPTNFSDLCAQIPESTSIAEQGDCRRFISCLDKEPISQRCRNGESFDSLLGVCRQNDGTCLLENGQRVGECNKRHGQLTRDANNCHGYFVCINGQKISSECGENEYFDKETNTCRYDDLKQCSTSPKKVTADESFVRCQDLSEAILYPYVYDHCRSYFQCVKGFPNIHECADGLYFDATSTRCVKEIKECVMPTNSNSFLRAPEDIIIMDMDTTPKHRCQDVVIGKPYANLDDHCHSYYVCESHESIAYYTCPPGTLYSTEKHACAVAKYVICRA